MTLFADPAAHADHVYVIAEIGVNHNGSTDIARQLIDVAVTAGADAVKFQTFTADDLVTPAAAKARYQVVNTKDDSSQYAMLKSLELDADSFRQLRDYCREKQIDFLSTPFSFAAVDQLAEMDVAAYKVSSGDLTHLPLLRHIAKTGKPIILSTGMGNMDEIAEATAAIRAEGNQRIVLLHCVSNYPAMPQECNLTAMNTLSAAFDVPVGWSDHTQGSAVSLAAVGLGACLIEKHFTLDANMPGPDHAASLEPSELQDLVAQIRTVSLARGNGVKRCMPSEAETAKVARRSIVATRDLPPQTRLTEDDFAYLRPGTGFTPAQVGMLIGGVTRVFIARHDIFTTDNVALPSCSE
jgi:N,N'-diacetyllegionaminate synthase